MKHVNLLVVGLLLGLATVGLYRGLLDARTFRSRDHFDFYLGVSQYRAELAAGHWPQSFPDVVRGGGHAFPRYYPPVSHLAALAADLLTGDVVRATHAAALLAVVVSVLGQFLLVFRLTGSLPAGVVAALVYSAFPYRFTQLYGRGAFAEAWAMAWYPFILLGGVRALQFRRPPSWWPVPIALLVLSHSVMAVWMFPVLGLLLLGATAGTDRRFMVGAGLTAGGWALGLVSFYALPLLAGLHSVRAAEPLVMLATPRQVAGAGMAGEWPESMAVNVLVALAAAAYLLVVRRQLRTREFTLRLAALSVAALVALGAMMVAPAGVWSLAPQALRYIQFPYRLLGPVAFLGSLALGAVSARRFLPASAVVATVFLAVGWLAGERVVYKREFSGRQILQLMNTTWPDLGLTYSGDYLPRESRPDVLAAAIQGARDSIGAGTLKSWQQVGGTWRAIIVTPKQVPVVLPLVYYDFLRVTTAGGEPVASEPRGGQLVVHPPVGRVELVVSRRMPAPLLAGLGISAVAAVALGLRSRRRNSL